MEYVFCLLAFGTTRFMIISVVFTVLISSIRIYFYLK